MAGVLLSETKYRFQVEADIAPFRGILLGLFFVTVGFEIDVHLIASNFPLWKSIVENNNCGICVDPLDPDKIAEAINYLADEFQKTEGIDLRTDAMAHQRLKEAAEKAKIELSSVMESQINLPFLTADASGPKHLNLKLTRAKLESMIDDGIHDGDIVLVTSKIVSKAEGCTVELDEVVDRFAIVGSADDHVRRLLELREAGVDQFNLYLMSGDEEEQLERYGSTIIPAVRAALGG